MNNMYSKPMPVSAGKVYPADQPMVFNSQNPNAPPIYPCGVCHKEVRILYDFFDSKLFKIIEYLSYNFVNIQFVMSVSELISFDK